MNLKNPSWIVLGFTLALCLLIAIAVISYRGTIQFSNSTALVSHTHNVISELDSIYAKLKDAETIERGYLITGDESFLPPYRQAVDELPEQLKQFRALISDNPVQRANAALLEELVSQRLEGLESAVSAYQSARENTRQIMQYVQGSKQINDRIRMQVNLMTSHEGKLLSTRLQAAQEDLVFTKASIGAGSIIALTLLCLLFFQMYKQIELRKAAQEEIEKANAQLSQYARQLESTNKELESFSYSVSHDLRSPLRAIDGFSRMLQEDYADKLDSDGLRLIGVIRESTKTMGQLIADLLEFSRLSRHEVRHEKIDMDKLVQEVWSAIPATGESVPPGLKTGSLPPIAGDRALLKQVLHNLLTNAVKYSSKKSRPLVQVTGEIEGHEAIYHVHDNGAGFDMRYYDKLFGVFQRLHSASEFPGTGVGLAIAHRVVTRHGGRIWAKSQLDQGSTFSFSLPIGEPHGEF